MFSKEYIEMVANLSKRRKGLPLTDAWPLFKNDKKQGKKKKAGENKLDLLLEVEAYAN